ncbi:MAG: potassium channel family protein [bacterium]
MFNVLLSFFRKLNILTSKHKSDLLRIFIVLVIILLTFSYLFSRYEKISFFKAFYWAVTTATTVGYGDVTPTNNIGRVIAMGLMIAGIGILGLFLATVSSIMFDFKIGRIFGTMESHLFTDHIVILGYSSLIKSSLRDILEAKENVTLVADIDKAPDDNDRLVFIKGSITDEKTISKAHIDKAKLCIISDEDDSNSLIAGINVRTNYKNAYIIALIFKKEVEKAFKEIGVNEVFSSGSFSSKVLVKSVEFKGASKFFNQLLDESYKEGLIERNIPENLQDKEFFEVIKYFKEKTDEIAVGIKRENEVLINPDKSFISKPGDKIILIGKK